MNDKIDPVFNDRQIIESRGEKNVVDPDKPYAWLVEKEHTAAGKIEDTAIVFLTNRECPWHCLMCDLWKNTTDTSVPKGAIPRQIEWALKQFSGVKHIKLYNSGSFFDTRAIPVEDYRAIAGLLSDFSTVIVENHPGLISEECLTFGNILKPELQIAMGLETVHPVVLKMLNKKMSAEDFKKAVVFLTDNNITTRAFILLKPPFMNEDEGIYWAERSLDFAFGCGVECCTIIPVRGGNGSMEKLREQGEFSPPSLLSLEKVLEYGIGLSRGRVFADTWDLHLFSSCNDCSDNRIKRLTSMNLEQKILSRVDCNCEELK